LTPEEAEAYKESIRKQQALIIHAKTFEQGIGWLKILVQDYPQEGLIALTKHLEKSRNTRHLTAALRTYKIFASLSPEGRETWNCAPTTYESIKRLNEEARQCYQQLQHQRCEALYNEHYQQLSLNLLNNTPSR
jgi:hypothetical protein